MTVMIEIFQAYLGLGLVFGLAFVLRGAQRLDPVASSGSPGFRLLILPGAAALWPYLWLRWLRASRRQDDGSASR